MKTFLDCWIGVASALLTQALAGESEFTESLPKPLAGGSFGFAVTVTGEKEGRFAVVLDAGVLEVPLLGEGVDQKSAWGELMKEITESAAGELLAESGLKVTLGKVEEIVAENKISRAFQLKTSSGTWTVLVRDDVHAAKKVETGKTEAGKAETAGKTTKTATGRTPAAAQQSADRAVAAGVAPGIDLLLDVELEATLRFGSRELLLGELLELGPGDVVQLDRHISDPVDLIIADKIVARGDVVLVNGNFGLRVTEVAEPRRRLETIRCLF
ncbi:FliM/FliN family flagellar motor switch protein [Terracidiphilus gabretensis]|jgi:flagellar motor switch protein FliN|uniref:FliM/FliN family flagellar motor switch protein n=1 Tax=Terracidiphilus gabretensis TaxID=1577687 RepID=UPI001E5A27B2|nr:FliM/FliN family flagellar motor switch protein [Terracidiphilus gabretensis]